MEATEIGIGVIKRSITHRKGNIQGPIFEWGHVGMIVIIKDITNNHCEIFDPDNVLNPIFTTTNAVEKIIIKWQRLK